MAAGALDRGGGFGNRETPAALAVLVLEHTATAFYLPLAVALLAPGDAASRITAGLGSAAAVAVAGWLVLGPAPLLRTGLFRGPVSGAGPALLLAGVALALAGLAAAAGVATAGIAYLAGFVLAAADPAGVPTGGPDQDGTAVPSPGARGAIAGLRDLSAALAGLALGLLVPAAKLPGPGRAESSSPPSTGATKVLTDGGPLSQLRPAAEAAPRVGPPARSRRVHPRSPGRTGRGGRDRRGRQRSGRGPGRGRGVDDVLIVGRCFSRSSPASPCRRGRRCS